MLDYFPNADHAGIFAAKEAGLYEKAGLDVEIQTPPDPSAPLKLLRAGRADVAISYEPELLLARDAGADTLVAVGALVQAPLTSLMALPAAGVKSAQDLAGKRVGTAGIPYQSAYLKTILEKAGVDAGSVKEINVGFNLVPSMLSGRVDATLGAFWNIEGVQLQRQHKKPKILRLQDLGVPTYDELVIVAREETVRHDGATIRRFLQALAKGTNSLTARPAAGIDPLVQANPDLDRTTQEAQLQETLPVLLPKAGKPYGWMEPAEWEAFARWMAQEGQLESAAVVQRAYTNEFLPGEGI